MSEPDARLKANDLLNRFAHVKVIVNKALLFEVERNKRGATAVVPRFVASGDEHVVCPKCGLGFKQKNLQSHLEAHEREERQAQQARAGRPQVATEAVPGRTTLDEMVRRDQASAERAQAGALSALPGHVRTEVRPDLHRGVHHTQVSVIQQQSRELVADRAIAQRPFDAMIEAEVFSDDEYRAVWYVHRDITTMREYDGVRIVSWTHPVAQIGLNRRLNDEHSIRRSGYAIRSVTPLARARFSQTLPTLSGLYDPGGEVNRTAASTTPGQAGLKAVKLDMTPEQVEAFLGRMNGVLTVTGAPGTGKTTVAFQRIRFLFDQQLLRDEDDRGVDYEPRLTRVFLASRNLIAYSTELLQSELGIPKDVVSYVPEFVADYVERVWQPRGDARPRQRKLAVAEERAREAMFNLVTAEDLPEVWRVLENQVRSRLVQAQDADWLEYASKLGGETEVNAFTLADLLEEAAGSTVASDPTTSKIRMDALWPRVGRPYVACRAAMRESQRNAFDTRFAKWLMWVYDPLTVLETYFSEKVRTSRERVVSGVGGMVDPSAVVDSALEDLRRRTYGSEQLAWVGMLLRFALPETASPDEGFREIQRAIPEPEHPTARRWTHVVIDEAQDLSAPEASLLASLVHGRGALTVSADYHQVVSPVHGMTDGEALKFGLPIFDRRLHTQYPFRRNMRQSREIGQFLEEFYQRTFGEHAPFEAGPRVETFKPRLYLANPDRRVLLIHQMYAALERSERVRRVALIQVDDDQQQLTDLRVALKRFGTTLAEPDDTIAEGALITTTVERAKGLEFDACVILGLDDLERASLNYNKNRAYVALSRPTQRLFLVCEHFPPLLRNVRRDLFEQYTA